ncbi:MAG TPA: adenylate/guanylate cyclase domain-containing protein [Actinomycetota bacterium]|nr:adenylate/guanylate cyclase domain-containing protein [Actinomycetota bacterium]
MQVCPRCGEENPDRFRLCGMCGEPLAPESAPQEVRKTVTIVFSDLKGSTSLGERLDTESLREVLSRYFTAMQAVLERHGGTVEKYIGDAIMAVFGLPVAHEDDAVRAVRAAAEMREILASLNDGLERTYGVRLENRTGVNTGEVVAGDVTHGQRLVTGDAVNVAARLEQNAPALEVLIGASTYRLVRDAVVVEPVEPLELKGKSERMPAYLLRSVSDREGVSRRHDLPIVGRERELATLDQALADARETRACRLVTVVAPAGTGKSRLLHEFLERAGDAVTQLRGRCLSYGDGITFWPLAEVALSAAGIENDDALEVANAKLRVIAGPGGEDVAERIGAAIGLLDRSFPVQETFWAARRLFELLGQERPLVVLVDDIHWAEQTFLDLLLDLRASIEGAPVLIVCSARPDLLHEHPEWERNEDLVTFRLDPLTDEESSQVVRNLLGADDVDARVRDRIIAAADGNPLFVEQMLSMLIDDGEIDRDDDGRWRLVSELGAVVIPPTISALLTARLDRLGPVERPVIERGAVIGQVFFQGAVEALAPEPIRPHVAESLERLVARELIGTHESIFAGQETFRFAHILIRDAAYLGLLKRARAELHERFVDWLEAAASDRVLEFEEIRGHHLEEAYRILVELGPANDHAVAIGRRGSMYLASAGRRALARGDMPAAAGLLRRAASILPPDDDEAARLLLLAGEAMIEVGDFDVAQRVLDELVGRAERTGDRGLEANARMVRLNLHLSTQSEGVERRVEAEVERALPVLEELGDHEGQARAWRLLTLAHWEACRWGTAEAAALSMVDHARLAGDRMLEDRVRPALATCALYGPRPVGAAIELCQGLLDSAGDDRKGRAMTLLALGHLEAMRGDFDRARELYRTSRRSLEELGWNLHAAVTSISSGPIELLSGDPAAAERELRRDLEALEGMGERYFRSTTAGFLAEALYRQGRLEEAEAATRLCEELAAEEDVSSQFLWRCVRAKVLARRGELEEAEAMVREGVQIIGLAEDPDTQATALLDLAEVLRLAGRHDEAATTAAEAARLFEQKGNVVELRRATELASVGTVGGSR